jgi:phosphatidylglycerol:prolipoprotein diacylglycerol transferase
VQARGKESGGLITFEPVKVLFHVGGLTVHSYGFFLALSFLAGLFVALWQGGWRGLDPVHVVAAVGMVVLGSMAGSRAYYVLEHIREFAGRTGAIVHIEKGGLTAIGGMLGGGLALIAYARAMRLRIGDYLDVCVPGLCLGIGITRIGCFLNWDDYGLASTLPWAVNAGDFPRHPTQLYHSLFGILLFIIFLRLGRKPSLRGRLFPLFLMVYGVGRFSVDFLRDEPRYFLDLTATQLLIPAVMLVAGYFFLRERQTPLHIENTL